MVKTRLDVLLVEKRLADSRAKAQALIMAGQVRVDGQVADRAAAMLVTGVGITVDQGARFVSRGGDKLEAALQAFPVEVSGRTCADVGSSTGGFTDCLLQHGAARVIAIDVGKGLLHWKLRKGARVVVMESTNARFVERLPELADLVTVDASFISLKILLPVVKGWLEQANAAMPPGQQRGDVIALIKPQFEAGRKETARNKGVIRDGLVHQSVLRDVLGTTQSLGFRVDGLLRSPVLGPKGNVEFLAWLRLAGGQAEELEDMITRAMVPGG